MLLVYIALGGAAGAAARYALAGWVYQRAGTDFPWGTLAVNVLGSFCLGLLLPLLLLSPAEAELRGMFSVGFLGAFTTFSTFSYETAALVRERQWGRTAAYILASLGLGLGGIAAGFALASLIIPF